MQSHVPQRYKHSHIRWHCMGLVFTRESLAKFFQRSEEILHLRLVSCAIILTSCWETEDCHSRFVTWRCPLPSFPKQDPARPAHETPRIRALHPKLVGWQQDMKEWTRRCQLKTDWGLECGCKRDVFLHSLVPNGSLNPQPYQNYDKAPCNPKP